MEQDGDDNNACLLNDFDDRPRSAVNSVVLDYYKKFGRKRDLEQYFSLSTAQSDIRDPRSLFWRRMKEQSDTSDSGEKKSESSNEICRISIKCSIPDRSDVEKRDSPSNNDSESPPIITDVQPGPSGDESTDEHHSLKSVDGTLDMSINKPLSPTSSITSQRKLEWDSLADVGYANESDRKTSASSLSTLEREVLAQKQQYTLDYKQASDLGLPTAHSTPVDPSDSRSKAKKGQEKKTISISRKDVDFVEVSVPHDIENVQPINVNLTKQFSVNLQKDGGMTVDNIKKDVSVSPEKNVAEVEKGVKLDKEIQTSLLRPKEKDQSSAECIKGVSTSAQKAPILICLNTVRRMQRRTKIRKSRKPRSKKKPVKTKKVHEKDKSGEQVSEAESFEYMPGHIYNQNQLKRNPNEASNTNNHNAGNKSSLESSAVHTTDSSKESKYSFSKDLDKTLNVLKTALKEKYDSNLKKKLVTDIIQRLLKSNYGKGENTPTLLSDLSLTSKKTTTSTSEADNTEEIVHSKPKKSILRINKFDASNVASTSQSAPNIPSVVNSDKPVTTDLLKIISSTTTETDLSNNSVKDVTSSDTAFAKTSSEELYNKYIDALKREEAYKQHLRDKELFLRQKLVRSETALKVPMQLDVRTNAKLKELIKDLTRNNYDDGSGDASKLEGGSSSNFDINRQRIPRKHRSHSVFTLSSGNSERQKQNLHLKNRLPKDKVDSPRAGPSNWAGNLAGISRKPAVTDSSVQVNINVDDKPLQGNLPNLTEEAKTYACYCFEKAHICCHRPDEIMPYNKCLKSFTKTKAPCTMNVCSIHAPSSSLEDNLQTNSASEHSKKHKIIHECTRCLQTKISIHPQISDPSVSDLNIIKSADCVKLINELYRKVSQTSSECQCSNEKDDCTSTTCKSSKDIMRRYGTDERDNLFAEEIEMTPLTAQQTAEHNVIQNRIACQKTPQNQPENISENIVIPIQGTNMMLKVSIGGKTMKIQDEDTTKGDRRTDTVDKDIATDKIKTSLKGTSVLDECSKSVQADNPSDINQNPVDVFLSSLEVDEKKDDLPHKTILSGRNINNRGRNDNDLRPNSVRAFRCSTYPKTVQIGDKKTFVRSNTDTGKLELNSGIQTDIILNKEKETEPCYRQETKQVLSPRRKQKSKGEYDKEQGIKNTSTENSALKSPKITDRIHCYNITKTKYCAEQQNKEIEGFDAVTDEGESKDLILDVIKDITKRYSKRDTDKRNKKKCFKEIITALSYLLDTDDSGDGEQELSKQSSRSKRVQDSREQGFQSEQVDNHILNEQPTNISGPYLEVDKLDNLLPQKNTNSNASSENMAGAASGCESKKNRYFSETIEDKKSYVILPKSEQDAKETTCKCSCGVADCKDCVASQSILEKGRSGNESCKLENQGSAYKYNKKKETAMDKKSLNSTKEKAKCSSPKKSAKKDVTTCGRGCGCDGSSECKECVEPHPSKNEAAACGKDSATSNNQESKCTLTKHEKTTCDRGCGCDGSEECKDCVEPHSSRDVIGACGKKTAISMNQGSLCKSVFSAKETKTTCDRACGCDGSKECKDCVEPHSSIDVTSACGKKTTRSKNQESSCKSIFSAKETKTTCDRGCGCDGSQECKDCVEPHSSKFITGKCSKESDKSLNQARCTSPARTKTTCDRGCGCDGSSECTECENPHSSNYGIGKCGIKSSRSRNISALETKSTCDRACGCDGNSECKECNHKTGKCGKETSRLKKQSSSGNSPNKFVNRCMATVKKVKSLYSHHDDTSDIPVSTDLPCCSTTDSPTAELVHKIRKECDKYQKRSRSFCKKCEASSSTAVSCDHCKRPRKDHCKRHRCRCNRNKSTERAKKKCVAYNLILQTSDSMISEEPIFDKCRPLQNVIVRVPNCKHGSMTFKEACAKIEQKLPYCSRSFEPRDRSQSWPNECGISSTDDVKIAKACTVREYLERNRPDFVDRCATRQNFVRMTTETRAKERSKLREQLVGLESLQSLNTEELMSLAKELGIGRRKHMQQIMGEREMKKHSENIYKKLPEVIQKKEDAKKERIKKTNLLMANIFRKNLQQKVLKGDVNISNYSKVVKI